MKPAEAMVLLIGAVVGVVLLGQRLKVPYPIALVIGGLCISLVPGLPDIRINPEYVFLLFLPPLLYAAGWFTSWHDFRANLRPIFLLAFGLVLFTTIVVGLVLHALIPAIPLPVAFVFGAIVSPPDAVAATALAQQICLPKRIVTILEGESLVNDATGLIALRFALATAASGSFSINHAAIEFIWAAVGGLGLGLLVAYLALKVSQLMKAEGLEITFSLLVPYAAYLPSERLHVSGVLAAVAAGIYGGWKAPEHLSAGSRLNGIAVWNMLVFLLNCILFILIGLELPDVMGRLGHHSSAQLFAYGAIVSAVVILIRPIWVFPATWLPRILSKRLRKRDPVPSWRHVLIVGWSGMRGVVSLAAALSLPVSLGSAGPLPERDLLIFLTFCVILSTLVVQGISLRFLVSWLGTKERRDAKHERDARLKLAHAGLEHLNKVVEKHPRHEAAHQLITGLYHERIIGLNDDLAEVLGWSEQKERTIAIRRLRLEGLQAERRELIRLRRERQVDEELMHRIERELDLEEARLAG